MANRSLARQLAQESLTRGDALGWFETLYQRAQGDEAAIPWADMQVNPNLQAWADRERLAGAGRKALVIGCGLGDDAELLAALGFSVTAFDISDTAIQWCGRRFVDSSVEYQVCDLLSPPSAWNHQFDFVFEAYTLQVLTTELRALAARHIAGFVATDGTLLVVTRGREPEDAPGQLPWPLVRAELDGFETHGLTCVSFEDYVEDEHPPVRRFRAVYRR